MPFITKALGDIAKSYKQAAQQIHVAEARALKRVGVSIKAGQSREITQTVNLRAGTIKDELRIKGQPTASNLSLVFQVKARGVPLREFIGTRETKRGVSVKVLKQGPRAVLRAAFGADKFGGHYFGRVGVGSKQYGSPHVGRLPIKKLYGPNVLSQYISDAVQQRGDDTWNQRLPIELDREVAFALKKAGVT